MELAIPLIALGGMYIASKQTNNNNNGFTNKKSNGVKGTKEN